MFSFLDWVGMLQMRQFWCLVALLASPAFAQDATSEAIAACDDQIFWCDLDGNTVHPGAAQISQQCDLFPSSCSDGRPVELADSGCIEDSWRNFCTDLGKLRDPTPAEMENLELGITGNKCLANCN
jgi:hypothetical protein